MTPRQYGLIDTWRYRRPERALLWASFLTIAAGFATVFAVKLDSQAPLNWPHLLPLAVYGSSLLLVHLTLIISRFQGDQLLVATASFLAGFGILAQYRMGTFDLANPQKPNNFAFPVGVLLMLAALLLFKNGRHRALAKLAIPSAVLSTAILAVILLIGQRFRGAVFAPGNLTPSEILKVLLVIFLAGYLAKHREDFRRVYYGVPLPRLRVLVPFLLLWGVPMALFVLQRDLGMVVIFTGLLLTLLLVATGRWGYLMLGSIGAAAFAFAAQRVLLHGQQRFVAWQNPFSDPTGVGWQTLQGLTALFSGGFWGTGLGLGAPDKIPIAASDFIYAAIGEELGFIGCLMVVLFYLIFFYRGFQVAYRTRSAFALILAAGLVSVIAAQTFLNIGGVVKFVPITGITLPFISQGGSSLITNFVILGLLLALSEGEMPVTAAAKRRRTPAAPPAASGPPRPKSAAGKGGKRKVS